MRDSIVMVIRSTVSGATLPGLKYYYTAYWLHDLGQVT